MPILGPKAITATGTTNGATLLFGGSDTQVLVSLDNTGGTGVSVVFQLNSNDGTYYPSWSVDVSGTPTIYPGGTAIALVDGVSGNKQFLLPVAQLSKGIRVYCTAITGTLNVTISSGDVSNIGTVPVVAQAATSFTLTAPANLVGANSALFSAGPTGHPTLNIDSSAGSGVTGIDVANAAAGSGVSIVVTSTATDEALSLNAKGAGFIQIGNSSTGTIIVGATGTTMEARPGNAVRCTSALAKTTDTALATITGLSVTLVAGRKYTFHGKLFTTSTVNGGVKVGLGGTATETSIIAEGKIWNTTTPNTSAQVTALGTLVSALVASDSVEFSGEIVCNAGGTLLIQGAQNTSHADTTTFKVGSFLTIEDVT